MSKCTAKQALDAFAYWIGYYEKANIKYSVYRGKKYFDMDKGSNNYTYPGYICGVNGQPWCAATVSNAIFEACGNDKGTAKEVLRVWPYVNCAQMWDAAPSNMRGRRGLWTPKPGDVIVFTDNGTQRTHTGMVYAVDSKYVYTYEGNSANMCRKRSYLLTSTYIYGYVRPNYADGEAVNIDGEKYGGAITLTVHELSKGTSGREVWNVQAILNSLGYSCGTVDGDFGAKTKSGVMSFQKAKGLTRDGIVGAKTWKALFD